VELEDEEKSRERDIYNPTKIKYKNETSTRIWRLYVSRGIWKKL